MTMARFSSHVRELRQDASGLATIEFAMASTMLMLGLLNGLEVARWSFQRMEVANAVHSAAHAVWNACDTKHLPAMTNCAGRAAAITNGLKSTSLGTAVTVAATSPTEGYYCLTSGGVLKKEADYTDTKPANCSAEGDSAHVPGDYLKITATYAYRPMFGRGITVGSLMPATLSSSSMIRLQ